jgi:hypothetical protein
MCIWMEFMSVIKYNRDKNQRSHKEERRKEIKQDFVAIVVIGLSLYKL